MSGLRFEWGFRGKTFWDWMQLLIVPVMLLLGAMYLETSQSAKQKELENRRAAEIRRIEDERYVVGILNDYRRVITELVKDNGLLSDAPDTGAIDAAEAITNATLGQLDGPRKGALLQFLFHSKLIGHPDHERAVLSLRGSELTNAVLRGGNLSSADLRDVNLVDADLTGTLFWGTRFSSDTNLAGANLDSATLKFVKDLKCEQLQKAANWASTIRDENLACGAPIPIGEGVAVIEVETTD